MQDILQIRVWMRYKSKREESKREENKQGKVSLDYRTRVLSMIKSAVQAYSTSLYEYWFNRATIKPFTFTVLMHKPQVTQEGFQVPSDKKIHFLFRSIDVELLIAVYNWLVRQFRKKAGLQKVFGSPWYVERILIERFPSIQTDSIVVRTLSPVSIRHFEKEDIYVLPRDRDFEKSFQEVIHRQLKWFIPAHSLNGMNWKITFEDINTKPTVVRHYIGEALTRREKPLMISAFRGKFRLSGPAEVLNLFMQIGLGSRRAQGFGMLEIAEA